MFKARDIMNTDIVTVAPGDTIDHAVSLLLEHGVSGLPVTDETGCLVGVISEFDLLELIYECQVEGGMVGQYMSTDVRQIDEDASWVDVADEFRTNRWRRLPVTRRNRLVGIVTRHDLMRAIQETRKLVQGGLVASQQ